MLSQSNRYILRELKKTTYKVMRQTHDLERGGKKRSRILAKKTDNQFPIALMLDHTKRLIQFSLQTVENEVAKAQIDSYFRKFDYYEMMIGNNCASRKPLQKKVVSCMLTTHTNLFNFLLAEDLRQGEITSLNLKELSDMFLLAVIAWNNDFRK